MNSNHVYDMLILGGGPGGYTAALYAARAGLDVLVLEKLWAGGQMALAHQIDNYPGFPEGVDGFTLGDSMRKQAERFGAVTKYAEVTNVNLLGTPKVVGISGEQLCAKTVVVATGAAPRHLGLEEETQLIGKGVAYCAACDAMFYKSIYESCVEVVSCADGGECLNFADRIGCVETWGEDLCGVSALCADEV